MAPKHYVRHHFYIDLRKGPLLIHLSVSDPPQCSVTASLSSALDQYQPRKPSALSWFIKNALFAISIFP